MNNDLMRLLIIEDDVAYANVLARRLTQQRFTCEKVHHSCDALAKAMQFNPTHVLLDMKLENDNGLHLIKPLRTAYPKCHMVLLTGFASIATAVEAMRLGANDYLAKPADTHTILKALIGETSECVIEEAPMSAERLEWEHIQQTLNANNGNVSATARQLDMHRRTLQRKLHKKPVQR